jgi:hypothetical protein
MRIKRLKIISTFKYIIKKENSVPVDHRAFYFEVIIVTNSKIEIKFV